MTTQLSPPDSVPLVSVILPVFNAEEYVGEAIQSILDQTFPHFELILIDDGSTDDSLKILTHFCKSDSRLILISRQNRGLVSTLNEAIDIARGTWIARMDADDVSLPDRFARQLKWLEDTGADICGTWVRLLGVSNGRILKHAQTDSAIKMEMLFGTPFAHPSIMIKTDCMRRLKYDIEWEKCEDYDLWERGARAGWRMCNVPETLLLYRQHGFQTSTKFAAHQLQLTQSIRRRYWYFIFDGMQLDPICIEEVIKLRATPLQTPDMDCVDRAFRVLLSSCQAEARAITFDHMTRLYFRAAGLCSDTAFRWKVLNSQFGQDAALLTRLKLKLLCIFRIQSEGGLFKYLKRVHGS